ncbi:MAG: HEAT repeat domain-containing protein [Nocardioidaceae bacterium]
MPDDRTIVERALSTECGSAVVSDAFITPANRDILRRTARSTAEPMTRRGRAIYLLRYWSDDETVATLEDVIDGVDEEARIAAASALGHIGTTRTLQAIERLAADPSADVRRVAINSLGRLDTPEATTILRNAARADSSELNRTRAADLLQ